MRPIDADVTIKRAIERYKEMMGTDIGHGMGIIASMITDTPTLTLDDIVPHGRWIMHEGYDECNLCHTKSIYGSNYCPNCGAKMDLETDNG